MLNYPPYAQDFLGLFVDIHDGSQLTLGQSTLYKDSAVRRGFIDGKKFPLDWLGELGTAVHSTHAQLRKAIIAALTPLLHVMSQNTGQYIHPSAEPELPLDRIKVWKWGPNAYFELHYRNSRSSILPVPAALSATWHTAYEHARVYRTLLNSEGVAQFADGLPNGLIDFPDPVAGASEPNNRPIGTVYRRPVTKFYIKSILNQNPHAMEGSGSTSQVGNVSSDNMPAFKGTLMDPNPNDRTVRYDGAVVNWIGIDRWSVVYTFTHIGSGHFHQVPFFNHPAGPTGWSVRNIISNLVSTLWDDNTFPVAY